MDYVKICKPAFFSNGISESNLFFDLLLGSFKKSERAEEYGESAFSWKFLFKIFVSRF